MNAPQSPPTCAEPLCERPVAEGDLRCELHRARLGARPSKPSEALPPIVAEAVLDAPSPAPTPAAPAQATLREKYLFRLRWSVLSAFGLVACCVLVGVGAPLGAFVLSGLFLWGSSIGLAGSAIGVSQGRREAMLALAALFVMVFGGLVAVYLGLWSWTESLPGWD